VVKELANIIRYVEALKIVCVVRDTINGRKGKMENLKVQVKKRYQNTLSRRFDIKNAECLRERHGEERSNIYAIRIPCNLCGVYYKHGCGNCPFARFESLSHMGCTVWLRKIGAITGNEKFGIGCREIFFKDYNVAKKELEQLRKKASEYIEWV